MFSKLSRVSPAMGVALVALALSLGGTSLAQGAADKLAGIIYGSSIKAASIPGNRLVKGDVNGDRIKSNSLTGKQINATTLGNVPTATRAARAAVADRATNAQRATNADNALALGGTAAAGFLTYASHGIPPGTTVTGAFGIASNVTGGTANDIQEVVQLPGLASADLSNETVNFAAAPGVTDADAGCTGTAAAPTAPAGKVCLYLSAGRGLGATFEGLAIPGLAGSRAGFVVHASNTISPAGLFGTWAYAAP